MQSYGRRKRSASKEGDRIPSELAERLVYDHDLGQEVIFFDTPLRKQIRVETGTKVDEVAGEQPLLNSGVNGSKCDSVIRV